MQTENSPRQGDPWLSVFCSGDTCLTEEEQIAMPSSGRPSDKTQNRWLEVFCPEDHCEADTPTRVV